MGPNEAKLLQIKTAKPGLLRTKRRDWNATANRITTILEELEAARSAVSKDWTGDDAEAAGLAFKRKYDELDGYRKRMEWSALAMDEAAQTLEDAIADLDALPEPTPVKTADPGTLPDDASQKLKDQKQDHQDQQAAYDADLRQRETKAGQAVSKMDLGLRVAQALLTKAAPLGDNPVAPGDQQTDPGSPSTSSTNGGAGGSSTGTPVVGGSASTDQMLTTTGAVATTGLIGGIKSLPGNQGSTQDGNAGSNAGQDLTGGAGGSAGMIGGGGTSAATSAAGVLGAGRGLLNRLTGGAASGSAGAPAGSSRTAGMQNGSTLGSRSAGQPASGSSAARPGGAPSSGAQSSAGRPGGAQPSAGRSGGAGQAGSRGAGPGTGSRGSGTGGTGGRGAGSGAGRGGQQRDGDDQTIDHMAFDDDQWLDDDETSPGVIA